MRDRLSWYLLALPGTALPGGYRMHHGRAGGSFSWGSGCGLAEQDRDRKGSTHMASSLPVATGTAWTEWLFHRAVGGQPIGWDPPYSSLSSVGPLLPGSFHCLSTTSKFRHVAPGCASPGACHLGPQQGAPTHAPCSWHPYRGVVASLQRFAHHFATFSPETGMLALSGIGAFSFLWGPRSHAAVAPQPAGPPTPIAQAPSSLRSSYGASGFICRAASYHMHMVPPYLLGSVLGCRVLEVLV